MRREINPRPTDEERANAVCFLFFRKSNIVEFLGWRHPKISGSNATNDSTAPALHFILFRIKFFGVSDLSFKKGLTKSFLQI